MKDSIKKPGRLKKRGGPPNIGSLCFLISKDLRTALDRALAPFALRAQQAAVLMRCCVQPGAKPSQLSAAVGTDTAGITGLIDQLAKNGLVIRRRDPSDRRAIIIEPTKTGQDMVPRLRSVFQATNDELLAGFTQKETTSLQEMLQRLRNNLRQYLVESAGQRTDARPMTFRREWPKKD